MEVAFQSHLYGIESNWRAMRNATLSSFNRTFMELKVSPWLILLPLILCFNRTFMELKDEKKNALVTAMIVSIAPLWN